MESTSQLLDRVEAEIAAGRLWRAKEILRGNIGSGRVDPAVLERYGRLLETLGEQLEAGKYLFLSGARLPAYGDAIQLFRRRHAKSGTAGLVGHCQRQFVARPSKRCRLQCSASCASGVWISVRSGHPLD